MSRRGFHPLRLAYDRVYLGSPPNGFTTPQPVYFLHSLIGSKDGWRSLVRFLNAQLKSLDVTVDAYLLDARHHGQSPHPDASNTSGQLLIDCVYDLDYFITKQATLHPSSPPPLLIGHSMGGKVFDAMLSLDLSRIQSRHDATRRMLSHVSDPATCSFASENISTLAAVHPTASQHYPLPLPSYLKSQSSILASSVPSSPLSPLSSSSLPNAATLQQYIPSRPEDVVWRCNISTLSKRESEIYEWPAAHLPALRSQVEYDNALGLTTVDHFEQEKSHILSSTEHTSSPNPRSNPSSSVADHMDSSIPSMTKVTDALWRDSKRRPTSISEKRRFWSFLDQIGSAPPSSSSSSPSSSLSPTSSLASTSSLSSPLSFPSQSGTSPLLSGPSSSNTVVSRHTHLNPTSTHLLPQSSGTTSSNFSFPFLSSTSSVPSSSSSPSLSFRGPVLFIGGLQSTRLTTPKYLVNLHSLYPNHRLCLYTGGHFVHQGESSHLCAETIAKFIAANDPNDNLLH